MKTLFINKEIENRFIKDFGIDDTIKFCKMASVMYKELHDDMVRRGQATNEYDEFDYMYLSNWWKNEYEQLKKRKDGRTSIG
jgi:hypothetical protein